MKSNQSVLLTATMFLAASGVAQHYNFAILDGHVMDPDLFDAPFSVVSGRVSGTAWSDEVLDLEKSNRMLSIIDEGLPQCAIGVASTAGYFPGGH